MELRREKWTAFQDDFSITWPLCKQFSLRRASSFSPRQKFFVARHRQSQRDNRRDVCTIKILSSQSPPLSIRLYFLKIVQRQPRASRSHGKTHFLQTCRNYIGSKLPPILITFLVSTALHGTKSIKLPSLGHFYSSMTSNDISSNGLQLPLCYLGGQMRESGHSILRT